MAAITRDELLGAMGADLCPPPVLRNSRQHAKEFLGSMGWQLMHTWQESHGNGGQDIYERLAPQPGQLSVLMVVAFDRGGCCVNIYQDRGSSYLLAKMVEEDSYGWKQIGKERISVCATASSRDYERLGLGGEQGGWDRVNVSSVVGHGCRAAWARSDGDYRCRECGQKYESR